MESSYGPNSTDEPSLLYKLQRKIKVFNTVSPLPNRGYNLVASCSKYGLVFIGTPDGILTVYHLRDLIDKDCEPQHIKIKLQEQPTHVSVSCDQELLAVTGGQLISVYKVSNFQNANPSSLDIRTEVNPSTFVSGLQWNPIIPDNLAVVFYDGTLLMANFGAGPQVKKVQSNARCLCWSPKGKQLVTGNNDGTLTQYKPDLTPAKNIPAPKLIEGGAPIESLAVYWISTFMFAVVYKNALDNSRPFVTIINTPKGAPAHCLNYEDICYSMGSNRPWYYYLQSLPQWSIIMASSSNSMEIATLGSKKEGDPWIQWCQSDDVRPELPLTDKKIENFPIGVCIDTCAIHQLPWGENQTLPFMPLLHVLTHTGLLTIFNIINMNNEAPQVCTPPQQLILPAHVMSSQIPGEAPAPAQPVQAPVPASVQVKPQPPVQLAPTPQPQQPAPPPQYSASVINIPKPPSYSQTPVAQPYAQAPPVYSEIKQALEAKPTPVAQTQTKPAPMPAVTTQTPQPVVPKPQTAQQAQENAALKAEQEKINERKANQELKNMLVKEVNDFQTELYKFMVKTRETQAKLQRDIDSITANFTPTSLDSEQLKKECSLEDLRSAIVHLKLELVRACAVVAEARTHAEAKDTHQWTQADPLTTKRVASVKKLAYYVQNQLEQAQKALDYKWNEALARDPHFNKPGHRMIRPILDDVYQPLVKQQEILSRQQAVLRTLRNTLKECEVTPMFKSTSLLRSTPFKTKDPLSKLTKNILNMSIEPEKVKEPLLSSQKLDALRDMLSNHKTVKIKPVNIEMREHLATMKLNYEKSLREKSHSLSVSSPPVAPVVQPQVKPVAQPHPVGLPKLEIKMEPKQEQKPSPISIPSFTPVGGMKAPVPGLINVARTLFTDEPKPEPAKPIQVPQPQYYPVTIQAPEARNPRSVLKDLLQNKQASLEAKALEAKSDGNVFMGQKICSPSSFASTTSPPTIPPVARTTFTAKPISDINNMFSKFQPPAFATETKPTIGQESKPTFAQEPKPLFAQETKSPIFETPKPQALVTDPKPQSFIQEPKIPTPLFSSVKSSETGEPEATETKTLTLKPKPDKPMTNLFAMKPSTPVPSSIVPDVLKTTQEVKVDKAVPKPVEKENLPKEDNQVKTVADKKELPKPLAIQTNKTASIFGVAPQAASSSPAASESKPLETKTDSKAEIEKPVSPTSSASSIFAVGNASIPSASKATQPPSKPDVATVKDEPLTPVSTDVSSSESIASIFSLNSSPSAASIFGAAVASQPNSASQASSIFASAATTASVFETATQGSIFGSSQATVQPASTTASKPTIFSTPTPASPSSTPSSVFGSATTTTPSGSIFGSSVFATSTTTQSAAPVFGSSTASVFGSTASPSSVFGATTTAPSLFSSTTATTQASIFSSVATTSTPSAFTPTTQTSVFGSNTATTQSSMFGTSGGSVFAPAGNANQASVFGASTQASSIFGAAAASTPASVFGATPTATTQTSVFGSPTPTTQASVFGNGQGQSSVFGSPPPTTTQGGSLFGGAEASMFASASISTTSAPTQGSGGSIFGSPSGSMFGSNNNANVFGSKTAFGQPNPTAASIFGGGGATSFGQKPANNFWSTDNSGTTGGGFGQQATTQASSIFGGTTGGSFSTPSPASQAFGSPQQSVFGTPQQQTGTGGFGSSFGGGFNKSPSSGFGAPAAFGGGATFGGSPAFGGTSPGNMFGGGAPAPAFTSTQSNATFESLANQNTLTFGNLAQQSGQQQQPAPSFNTSPSFTGWRG